MAAIAFEIQHRVDHVLQHARPGDGAVLGDVADQHQGEAGGLGQADQLERGGADLGDGAGRALDGVQPHGLDRIDHHQCRVGRALQRRGDVAQVDRGGEFQRRVDHAQAAGAQPHLFDRFLAGDIQHPASGAGQRRGGLQQQGGLADAGIAADQDGRSGDQAAAEDAIQLVDAGAGARRRRGLAGQADEGDRLADGGGGTDGPEARRDRFLDDGVPFAAGLAAAGPFGGDRAAALADKAGGGLGQRRQCPCPPSWPAPAGHPRLCRWHEGKSWMAGRRRP